MACWTRIRASEPLPRALDGKHPVDARALGIPASLPSGDLRDERRLFGDATPEALSDHHADLDLDHVQPARVLWCEMEFDAAQDAAGLFGREALVQRGCRVSRQVVEDDADALSLGIVIVDEVTHAFGEVDARPSIGHLRVSPWAVHVDKHEDVGGAIAHILVVEAPSLPRLGTDRHALLADQLARRLVEADDGSAVIGWLGVEREHVLHAGDEFGVDL